jgi:hypothetical protein
MADEASVSVLQREIVARRLRTPEFKFIHDTAERMGFRAWLFGGSAAAEAHYAKWDLEREHGDQRFQPDRFDYEYTNIFRSNQDADIVIDGTRDQARAFEAVIRDLTKAFQYDLKQRPEDLPQLREIIHAWDPAAPVDPYVRTWIEKNGKKLIQNAVNFESAWDQLQSLGLREKLIQFSGNPFAEDSLAWWMSREPLRSSPVGQGQGKTAKEMGLDIVSHETDSLLAYESITRSHTGDPNVLVSRGATPGEQAKRGSGFYTSPGAIRFVAASVEEASRIRGAHHQKRARGCRNHQIRLAPMG